MDIGKLQPGETVVISGAAGAVGSIAGQIAKIHGCRAIGTAGTDAKVEWLLNDLGFDAAYNYKTVSDHGAQLGQLCPAGIHVYFDNTGGPVSDAVLSCISQRARVVLCGQISQYNADQPEMGPRLLFHLIVKRARMEGFLVSDYASRWNEGLTHLAQWVLDGRLKYREQFFEGIENAPRAFIEMMQGANTGKMLVRLRDPR